MKTSGKISYFSEKRGFGIIEAKDPNGVISRFWFHVSKISVCKPDKPEVGCPVVFDIEGQQEPIKDGYLPRVVGVEVGSL